MKMKSAPSRYRKVMSRRSTFAVSTLVPALKVLSTTLPVMTFFSVVRTKAPPLPGLTCWNSVTVQRLPSIRSTRPFFRSFVVATGRSLLRFGSGPGHEVPGALREGHGPVVGDDQRVLDPDPAPPGQVDPRLDGDRHPRLQGSGRGR